MAWAAAPRCYATAAPLSSPQPPRARRAMHPLPMATSSGSAHCCAPRATGRAALPDRSSPPSSKRDCRAPAAASAFIVGRAPVCVTASEASRLPLAFRASQNILRLEKQSDFIGHLYFVDVRSTPSSTSVVLRSTRRQVWYRRIILSPNF